MNLKNATHTLRLREYYFMFLRHKFLFSAAVTLCLIASISLAFLLPKAYRAETVLLVEDEEILNPLISGLAVTSSAWARMKTLREELLSWQRLTLLVEKLGLDKNIPKTALGYEHLIKRLREHLSIRFRESDTITVSFEGPDPRKTQEIVQTLGDIIIKGSLTSSKLEASSAIGFIQGQLATYRNKLEESEEKLRLFKELYSSTFPVATRMNEELVNLKIELNNLLIDNTEAHPRVVQTRKLIKNLESQRDKQMEKARVEGVPIDPMEYAKLVSSVPRQEQQLARLQRDYIVNDRIYSSLLQRLETAKISQTLEQSDKGTKFQILEAARLPIEPVKPKKLLIVLGGLVIGLAFGGALIYLLEMSDTSIRSLEEARTVLEFPIFGIIPPIRIEELLVEESMRQDACV